MLWVTAKFYPKPWRFAENLREYHEVYGQISAHQGRIYVANEYPTFARTMSMVGQNLTFLHQITLNVRQNLSVLMKNMQILG